MSSVRLGEVVVAPGQSYSRGDKFLTNIESAEVDGKVGFLITEIYGDGCYGGPLFAMDDALCHTVDWLEVTSSKEIAEQGWMLFDGPSTTSKSSIH